MDLLVKRWCHRRRHVSTLPGVGCDAPEGLLCIKYVRSGSAAETKDTATDSTIQPAIFLNERFVKAARHEEWCYEENIFMYFFGCKGLSNDGIELAGGTVFYEIWSGVGFKTRRFPWRNVRGGYRRTTPGHGVRILPGGDVMMALLYTLYSPLDLNYNTINTVPCYNTIILRQEHFRRVVWRRIADHSIAGSRRNVKNARKLNDR